MKILVTGGTGFVGTAILHELRTRGLDVRALVRSTRNAERVRALNVEPAFGDVTDAAAVLAAARGCTHVVHLVAIIRGRESDFERVMVGGTRNVIAAGRTAGPLCGFALFFLTGTFPFFGRRGRDEGITRASPT